jgi:MFS family permease
LINRRRIFVASCLALFTTSAVFAIRGDILDALGVDFHLNNEQLGILLSPAFWGCTISILIGGGLVDFFGMRRLLLLSGGGYFIGVSAIIFAPHSAMSNAPFYLRPGFIIIYAGMLMLGLAQGLIEGTVNPLCATLYSDDKARRFNHLHAWWPAGIVIGGLLAFGITKAMGLEGVVAPATATLGWRLKIAIVLIPTAGFCLMVRGQEFPETERVSAGVPNREMFRSILKPMFLLWIGLIWLTTVTELGPEQWIPSLITHLAGMQGILVLAYTQGIFFLVRFFGGGLVHKLSPYAVLAIAGALACIGNYFLGTANRPAAVFLFATVFGLGTPFFWPVMLSTASEQFPKTGAAGLAVLASAGQLATAFALPIIGHLYDLRGPAATFRTIALVPFLFMIVFVILLLRYRTKGGIVPWFWNVLKGFADREKRTLRIVIQVRELSLNCKCVTISPTSNQAPAL